MPRWAARAWAATSNRLRGGAGVAVYAFGKHPAFADFIDVAKLPPVPPPFRHFHDVLRPAVERGGGLTEPMLIAWRDRGSSSVLWVQPSRDRSDGVTGRFRRCPLLLGATAAVDLSALLPFAGESLGALAAEVMTSDAAGCVERIARAAADWPAAFAAGGAVEPQGIVRRAAAAAAGAGDGTVIFAGSETIVSADLPTMSAAKFSERMAQSHPLARAVSVDP